MLIAKRLLAFLCIVVFVFACITLIQPTNHVHAKEDKECLVSFTCSTCPSEGGVECSGELCATHVALEGVVCDGEYTFRPIYC